MTEKETHWSKLADNFEEKTKYIVGEENLKIFFKKLAKETYLGNTLELACGCGMYSKILATNTKKMLSTDFSEQMVEMSKEELKSYKNITVEQANCLDLSYDDNTFDTVFMANLLHVLQTPEKAISEAKRVVKQGGQIIAIDYTSKEMSEEAKKNLFIRYIEAFEKRPEGAVPVDDDKMKELFERNGLKTQFVKIIGGSSKAAYGKAEKI